MEFIFRKIEKLKAELNSIPFHPEAEIIIAKIDVLEEILKESARKYRIALLKANQQDYDMGMLTPEQYHNRIEEINQLKNQ